MYAINKVMRFILTIFTFSLLLPTLIGCQGTQESNAVLLHVSYDPTRELFEEINQEFNDFRSRSGLKRVEIRQSHGGSGKQSRAVSEGLQADIVSLALPLDVDRIASRGILRSDWRDQFPNTSTPFNSTIVFLVKRGNPKKILDWRDLARRDISVITPNPKTSGGARLNYLALYGVALDTYAHDIPRVEEFIAKVFFNVPVLESGARSATTTFAHRGIGDVLITWESEAMLALRVLGSAEFEVIKPNRSILAMPPVAIVDHVVDKKGTREIARDYINFMYSPKGQEIAAKHHFRPIQSLGSAEMRLFTVEDVFGDWKSANSIHFSDGGSFDRAISAAEKMRSGNAG